MAVEFLQLFPDDLTYRFSCIVQIRAARFVVICERAAYKKHAFSVEAELLGQIPQATLVPRRFYRFT
jgi:hypothetical protein